MKRITLLLAALMLVSSTVGCGCCRRLRDRLCRGSYCGPAAAVAPAAVASPGLLAGPAAVPTHTPVQTPVAAPAPMMMAPPQMMPSCVPCDPCCIPCDPCCGGYGYYGVGYPMGGGMYDSGWSGSCGCDSSAGSYDGPVSPSPATRDPGPANRGDAGI
ncbi:hypothetical protein KOR34_23140 [Posidoniimonas corsicana]|uniref:Uncharacterized protein n=1 Tax=Posidoniimonas corsicana TaxID=1938618 RepID=A0A5C5VFD8_9BACT|nr:hypothetical protein [Posidoniimonas corsicana]TWT37364.1 hypothetical protein KOR34_23140 [Posidoniimonas corsicana]